MTETILGRSVFDVYFLCFTSRPLQWVGGAISGLGLGLVPLYATYGVNSILTAFGVCLRVLVQMLDATRVEGAGAPQNTVNLEETETGFMTTY